ncbi:MAG: hypothetical protein AT709_00510 [Caldivirga sp. MG_3]|nr:MAG: hypothetical protein AT709_00510 [Caldivirga sp. MG_3]
MLRAGQARLIEAVAAVTVLVVIFSMIPMLFKTPLTPLRSQVQVDVSQYAYNSLYALVTNPVFIASIQNGNWSELHSLASLIVGPQFNWFIGIEPLYRAYMIGSYRVTGSYVAFNVSITPSPGINGGYALVTIPIYILNQGLPLRYRVNTTVPMANVFITTSNGGPVYWWLQSYDYVTGEAEVWLYVPSGSGRLTFYVSTNSDVPYNPLSGSYCKLAYCPPYGGASTFMADSTNLQPLTYNNGAAVFNTQQGYSTYLGFTTGNINCGGNGYYSIGGYSLTLNVPQGSTETCSIINPGPSGSLVYMVGQLIKAIPGAQFNLNLNYQVTLYSGNAYQQFQVPVTLAFQYGSSTMNMILYINGQKTAALSNINYIYLYGLTISAYSYAIECPGNLVGFNVTVSVNIHDYVSGVDRAMIGSYQLPCSLASLQYNPSASTSMNINGAALSLTSPPPSYPNYYYYNTTEVIYDLLFTSPAYSTLIASAYVNYAILYNVVPSQYAYGIVGLRFTPTTGAYTVIVLPNGTYYLIALELQSLSGG